jgi:transposase-like protein
MSSHSRIELYKEAMLIEQERAALQAKLDQLHTRLQHIQGSLFSAGNTAAAPAAGKAKAATAHASPSAAKPRAGRGELKGRILDALAAAGNEGIRVRDLAITIGSKPAALHSWFQFARKSIPSIRKAGKGRYRLVGSVSGKAPAAKPEAAAKPARAAKKTSGKQRGQVSIAVQAALQAAGKEGAKISDLARTLDLNPRNLFVWFATTGKKFKAIKKVGPGHYRLQS